ncbi:MAG: NADH-quinone oxidoreductase subunit L [Phycisphaerales bacterium]|nr:NADH-quinone oxidoreductase subunit L [Phycisphaerales bacterium]
MEPFLSKLLAASLIPPFLTFWILVLWGPKIGKPRAGWVGLIGGMGLPLLLSTIVFVTWFFTGPEQRDALTSAAQNSQVLWSQLGDFKVTFGVKLDSLTVAIHFMVCFIAFWIFFFSIGYMAGHSDCVHHQSKYWRFFAYLALFGFSMLGLVISPSLLFLFIFWELVGLCSYLLIGFYFDTDYAPPAAMKAFITNRVGDFGFIIGLGIVFTFLGTLDLEGAAAAFKTQLAAGTGLFAKTVSVPILGWSFSGMTLATLMGIGLFCGAMGKSAQFPLHVWLPDAMAGPTPVSALIHAATMVAAGVYLVARVFRLLTPDAQMFVAVIGCITLTFMALIAIVQTDIKKCLAYSTLSQLGYMIFGMGVGAWTAALFHLVTHAFFKAMLFLGSGQVIEGCHHVQDMRRMGGLKSKMPVTCWTFFIGVLAIAGTGIPGFHIGDLRFGLGGFFSKDEILAVAYDRAFNWGRFESGGEHAAAQNGGWQIANSEREEASESVSLAAFSAQHKTAQPKGAPELAEQDAHAKQEGRTGEANGHGAGTAQEAGGHGAEEGHGGAAAHHASAKDPVAAGMKALPKWMFLFAIITAYITPFYMFRAWWLTFMGKPRDPHVHEHAHESKMMTLPLAVLAVGTLVASYALFRPMLAHAAPVAADAPLVVAVDGEAHDPAASLIALDHSADRNPHSKLVTIVGFSFLVGFAVAWLVYRKGLGIAERLKNTFPLNYLHTLLEHKYYFDELYGFLWVRGCRGVAAVCGFIDTWVIDLVYNLLSSVTERLAAFTGRVLDAQGVDGFVNGISETADDLAEALRRPQTGGIRKYVLWTVGIGTAVIAAFLLAPYGESAWTVVAERLGFGTHGG